jgi:hypothetical protein
MSLPLQWVDKIFLKLTLVYGREFIGRWEGLEIADVKTDWGHELAGFEKWPEAIAYALANLPTGKPPTVIEFRAMAAKAPRKVLEALPAPMASPEKVAAELEEARKAVKPSVHNIDGKAWARALIEREKAGEVLGYAIGKLAHAALRSESIAAGEVA